MSIEHPESDNMEMAILAGDTTYDISEVKLMQHMQRE